MLWLGVYEQHDGIRARRREHSSGLWLLLCLHQRVSLHDAAVPCVVLHCDDGGTRADPHFLKSLGGNPFRVRDPAPALARRDGPRPGQAAPRVRRTRDGP